MNLLEPLLICFGEMVHASPKMLSPFTNQEHARILLNQAKIG